MMTSKEMVKLIEQTVANPDEAKEALKSFKEFAFDYDESYLDNRPEDRHTTAGEIYRKLVKEYLKERAYDTD